MKCFNLWAYLPSSLNIILFKFFIKRWISISKEVIYRVENLKKSFGDKAVLQGISFNIFDGEILGIVGKSGTGKSTFLKILSNIIKNYEGSIEYLGSDLVDKKLNEVLGFSFQPYSFYEELTLKGNLMYFGNLYGLSKNQILTRAEELFNLTDLSMTDLSLSVRDLSGGMKKRFDIVCSLLHDPKILILDEPTAGLDPLRRKQLTNIIHRINSTGVTILMSSHIMSDIEGVCDRVLLIDNGKLVLLDSPSNIKSEFLEHEQITIKSYPGRYEPIIKYLSGFSILKCKREGNKLIILSPETEILVHFILHLLENSGELLQDIIISEPGLEDVFELLEGKTPKTLISENVDKLNQFIYSLIGKRYSQDKINEIMMSHRWPKEIVEVLVGKRILRLDSQETRGLDQ